MSELHDAISLAIKEALVKNDTLSLGEIYKKIAEAISLEVDKVKEILGGKSDVTEEQLPKIAEVVGTTVDALKETADKSKKAKEQEDKLKEQKGKEDQQKKDKLKETVSTVFGERSELREKLTELKKLIESNKDEGTRNWISEIVHSIVEAVPLIAANSDDKAIIEEIKSDNAKLKEDMGSLQLKYSTLETQVKANKGLTETIKNAFEKNQHGGGKGLHEQQGGDTGNESSDVHLETFDEKPLSRILG